MITLRFSGSRCAGLLRPRRTANKGIDADKPAA